MRSQLARTICKKPSGFMSSDDHKKIPHDDDYHDQNDEKEKHDAAEKYPDLAALICRNPRRLLWQ